MSQYVDNKDISELVRTTETQFISGGGTLMSKYVTTDLYDDINKIEAYLNSKHTTGPTDSLNREKPFFNIVLAARNIWYRATDIDRKDIQVKPSRSTDVIPAFLATVHIQNWMRKMDFGSFLNKWGIDLAGYLESVVKFIETDGELHCMVVPWPRLICDQINFDANPKIELLELTESELYQRKGYDQEMVEKLCDALQARELTDRTKQDQKSNYIKLYEVHGSLPLSYLTGNEKDKDEYVQQMHVLSFVESKNKGEFDDFTLYSGREEQDPYMLTSLLPTSDGSITLNGSVKNLFTAQWMMNHTVKSIKDQMDIASKLMFQTADENYVGRNVLAAVEQGDILIHKVNMPLTQVNNVSHDVTTQQSFSQMWKSLSSELNGISESMMGLNPPSGTAWRQTNQLLQESHSLFELMTENKGLCIEKMLRTFVIPFLKKKMDTSEEIAATLEADGIRQIDSMYIPAEAARRFNRDAVQAVLNGKNPSPYNQQQAEQAVQKEVSAQGAQRFFKPSDISSVTWKDFFKDMEWELEVDVTGEASASKEHMDTMSTVLQTISNNPRVLTDPNAKLVFNKILSMTGAVSPLELAQAQPFSIPPMKRFVETLDYADAPEDIKRQMEEQQGFQPSQLPPVAAPPAPALPLTAPHA